MKKRYGIVTLILILCVGVIFSGCGPDYSSLSLSLNDVSKIELSITDEKVDYFLTINNYFDINAQFSFDFANKVAKVIDDSVQHQGNGIYKFSIAPITAGNTTLTITLKGLNKPLVVPVSVKKAVESITASANQFVKKGESLKLNSSMFTFTPEDTTERNLDFALAEIEGVDYTANNVELDAQNGILTIGENCELNTITIVASSNYDKNVKTNIVIKVVQKIDISSLKLQIASQNLENASQFDEFSDLSLDETINLIISEKSSYQKKIYVEYGLFEQGYSIEINASNQINLGGENIKQVILTQNSSFILSSNDVGTGKITLKIYQNDLPENYVELELNVNSICKPRNITVNGQTDVGLIELYTNSSQVKEYKFGISPAKANKEDYNYLISFYSNLNEQKIVEENKVDNLNGFVYLNYGGVPLTSNNLGSLNTTLTLQAKENSNDKYLAIKIDCVDADTTICSLVLYVKVYIGTTEFKIDEMYKNGTIYLPLKDVETSYSFYGLRCSEGATPGKLSIAAERVNVNICEIEQESTTNANLTITPKFVGTQDFVITTANNLSVVLKIVVFRELDSDDADAKNFVVQIADTANDNVSSFEPTDTNKMLQSLTLKGKNSSVNLSGKILTNYSDYNAISYNYALELTSLGKEYFEIKNNRTITSLKFTSQEIPLTVVLKRNIVKFDGNDNCLFQIEEIENRYTINLNCVNFIKELTLYASNNNTNEVYAKNVSVYNKIDLSYINENLATVYLYMDLVQSADEEFSGLDISNFTFKSGAEIFDCSGDEVIKVGEIGYFYPKLTNLTKNESGYIYIGSFTYEYNNLRTLSSINIILKLTDNNTSKEFSSDVTLTIERYIDVESLWLSTPESMIYLDNTNSYSQKTISVQVLPANAKCQDLDVKIDTAIANCIGVDIRDNVITFSYQKAGSGKILIFPISKLKNGTYRDNSGEYYYHLELDFVCADGESEQTALKISTFEDLKNLNSDKHYFIDSTIDCGGKTFDIPELNKSIRGTFLPYTNDEQYTNAQQIGSIINFVVSKNNNGNIGLFRTINSGAKIYNLTLSGRFDSNITVNMSTNIGLLCGTNNGLIRNVNISLSNKNVVAISKENTQNVNIYMGIVSGINNGTIVVDSNSKDSTMLVNTSQSSTITTFFAEDIQSQTFFGGIAGQNTANGIIKSTLSKDFLTIGLYGINANIFAQSNANYFAGIVAENQGEVSGLKVTGEIDGSITIKAENNNEKTYGANVAAGFIGFAKNGIINNNISRIFVRGMQLVSGFIGECENIVTLQDNKVQATDDGTRQGINASFIVGYGKDAKLYAVSNNSVAGIISETYFDRTLPASFMAQVEETTSGFSADLENKNSVKIIHSDSSQKNIENKDITLSLTNSLSKDFYYGEIVKVVSNTDITFVDYQKEFVRGKEDDFNVATSLISDFVLAAYLQIENETEFGYLYDIINKLETKSLLEFTNLLQNNKVKDLNIEILNSDTARLDAYGKYISLINIGELKILIKSSLNYKKYVTLNAFITNYYDGISLYIDRGKSQSITSINLTNKQTSIVYLDLFSSVYNHNNYPVSLKGNSEVTFDYKINTTKVDVKIQEQTAFLASNNISTFSDEITFTSKFIYNNQTYYKIKNEIISNNANKKICAFVLEKDLNKISNYKTEETSYKIDAKTGIENIRISKSVVEAEPSDNIEIYVSYTTYNENDKIITKLRVYNNIKENDYVEYALTGTEKSGVFKDELNNVLFTLYCETIENSNNNVKQKYLLKMPISDDFNPEVYNYLKNKRVELIFGSNNNLTQQASLVIEYTPETISSVLINNFNKEFNIGMIQTENGISTINVNKTLTSGKQSSTGELNLLNAYVYTKLSEFEYVDVTMSGFEGGYLGLVNYSYVDDQEIGRISNSTLYTVISNGVTMRIFKTSNSLGSGNTLRLGIVYSIPKTVEDGTIVPITFTFYNGDNKEIYVESISLITRTANQVSFDIVGKTEIKEIDDTKTYEVARGLRYLLDTTIVGYEEDEVVFESSNPSYAYVSKEGNNYYLSITNASIIYNLKDNQGNDIPYFPVTIRSYGQKLGSGANVQGVVKTTILNIYEFLANDSNLFGDTKTLAFRLFDWVNVKNLVADKITCENSSLAYNAINNFKNEFKNNANFYIIDKDLNRYKLENGLILKLESFEINCSNNEYRVKSLKTSDVCDFKLEVEYVITYKNGMPIVVSNIIGNTSNIKSTTFEINTYISTTGDKPTPVFDYNDMQNMQDGEYYRQVADINIKADELKMIEVSPKLFDGNGYKINILSGSFNFNLDSSSDFALFKTLNDGCIIKNVSIVIVDSLRLTLNNNASTAGANISLLVAENNGIITNCSLKSKTSGFVSVEIINTVSVMERSYFAGLCAKNSGYISDCQIECNLTANGASLGGVVADNSGYISSCYIKNSRIYNTTTTTSENIVTGGFVCKNLGSIKMCYIEGAQSDSKIYSDYITGNYSLNSKIIYTATKVAGFVYNNSGEISDCYSNIPIVSSNDSSGFVAIAESGKISRVFSLCKLKQQDTHSFGFVANYDLDEVNNGMFEDCFFIIQKDIINYNTSESNYKISGNSFESVISGITPLKIIDFNVTDKNGVLKTDNKFASFITDNEKINGVWFYAFDEMKDKSVAFDENTYICNVEGFDEYGKTTKAFTARRLQLVSPNLISFSKQDLILDENGSIESGEFTYQMSINSDILGSKTNPYLISSAKEFTNYCNQNTNVGYEYFRLICDINFIEEEIYSTSLYNNTLLGYFDGNGFAINGYSVNSTISNQSAGLFAELGKSGTTISCLKNLTLSPQYINLPNSVFVGGFAGSASNASIYNINMISKDVTIVGKNIVGGMFGRTYGQINMALINSNINVKSTNYNTLELSTMSDVNTLVKAISYNEIGFNKTKVSYAGAIVGYAGGIAEFKDVTIGENTKVQGMIAGLLFGGIGPFAEVSQFKLELNSFDNKIVAYAFGGYVAGEAKGVIKNFELNSEIINSDLFSCYPIAPVALGGVVGYASGLKLSNFTSTQGYAVIGAKTIGQDTEGYLNVYNPYIAKFVGGVIGYGEKLTIDTINIKNDNNINIGLALMGGNCVGGIVGYVGGTLKEDKIDSDISNVNINLIGQKTYTNADEQEVTDKLYISYVSEAVGEAIGFVPNEKQYFGLLYGFGISAGVSANELKLLKETQANIVTISNELFVIFLGYKIDTRHNIDLDNNIHNFSSYTYNNKGTSIEDENKIVFITKNLSTNEIVKSPKI